jgi:hypothetical protein
MASVGAESASGGSAPLVSQLGDERVRRARSSEVVEQAKFELSARYGFHLDEAFEMLCALARSQRCSVEDFADSVVRHSGRFDGDLRAETRPILDGGRNGSETTTASRAGVRR